ncbi:hypothetical protein B0H12DRAFT_1234612 [Mycena haematopus]|nr:hypothetical protein B0H12DRAFT_1234612 [Mycena haematopus]
MSELGGPQVPPEIVDQILRELDPIADKNTLCTSALVSHIWLAHSRAILFFSIFIAPFRIATNDGTFNDLKGVATMHPYVRDIHLSVPPMSEWTETHMSKLLAKFPECNTLRIPARWETVSQWEIRLELGRLLRTAVHSRRRAAARIYGDDDDAESPFVPDHAPSLLAHLHTVHLDYPQHNVPILTLLAAPSLHTLDLTIRESDPAAETLHASLRACGPALRTLVLRFPCDLHIGQPSMPLPLPNLHTALRLHASGSDHSTPLMVYPVLCLPELVVETDVVSVSGAGDECGAREELDRVVRTLPALRTVRIPS